MLGLGALNPIGLEHVGALKPGGSGVGSSLPTLWSNKVQVITPHRCMPGLSAQDIEPP